MKKIITSAVLSIMTISMFSQTITVEENGKVTVSSDSTTVEIEAAGSGAIAATLDESKTEVLILHTNGDVFVKRTDGTTIVQLAEPIADKAVNAVWGVDNTIVITRQSGITETSNALEWR